MVTYSCFVKRTLARLAQLRQLGTGSKLEVPACPLDPNATRRISILVAELKTVRLELLSLTHDRNKHAKKICFNTIKVSLTVVQQKAKLGHMHRGEQLLYLELCNTCRNRIGQVTACFAKTNAAVFYRRS